MDAKIFPTTLKPDSTEVHTVDGEDIHIPVTHLFFRQWTGTPITNTFGGKGLINYEDIPMFAELAIQRTAVKGGWNARWIETYAMKGKIPYYFTDWGNSSLSLQTQDPIKDLSQTDILATVAENNHSSYSGCWDVFAWNGDRTIFIESKRSKRDRFKPTQDRWLRAGLLSGLNPDNFLIVMWDFI